MADLIERRQSPESPPVAAGGAAADELCFASARSLAHLIRTGELSARELMTAELRQIERLNPRLNAIVAKLDDAACLALAAAADRRVAEGAPLGPLHGLPFAFKDLEAAVGFPCTQGSPLFRDVYPAADTVLVERLRNAGVVPIGKTNVPEFGMGSQTYNRVYGTTLNPYDLSKCAGGSSGGAGAGVAAGMLPLADGSDLGGSLRNPGNFNNVVGFRPSVGLVPVAPTQWPCLDLAVKGPIGRSVGDVALLLSVMAGPDPREPACQPSDPASFAGSLDRDLKGLRIAWCPDLGGLPLDPRVRGVLAAQRRVFESMGCVLEDACPELGDAEQVFLTLRRWRAWTQLGALMAGRRAELKPEAVEEIEAGRRLSADDIGAAMTRHGALLESMRRFQETYPFLVCAVNQVPPFEATLHWPTEIGSVKMSHYLAWMQSAYWITPTLCPAISVPAGFTADGLPVGIQIVGRYRDDLGVLQLAHAFEGATGIGKSRPPIAT